MNHWGNYLVKGFPRGQKTSFEITVDPDNTHASMVLVASRIQALIDALGPLGDDYPNHDPLEDEDTTELLRLADHLHRVILNLTGQEDRLIELLAGRKGASTRTIATHLEVAPQTVLNRLKRISAANEAGLNTAAYQERLDEKEES